MIETFIPPEPPKPIEVLAEEGIEWAIKEMNRREIIVLTTYLTSTDWYVVRFSETLVPIPEEILQKRQEARDTISQLRDI